MNTSDWMKIAGQVPVILKTINDLVKVIEYLYKGDGTGVFKKQWVMKAFEGTIHTMIEISEGGQKETWEKILQYWDIVMYIIDTAIDYFAGLNFPHPEEANQVDVEVNGGP